MSLLSYCVLFHEHLKVFTSFSVALYLLLLTLLHSSKDLGTERRYRH